MQTICSKEKVCKYLAFLLNFLFFYHRCFESSGKFQLFTPSPSDPGKKKKKKKKKDQPKQTNNNNNDNSDFL